MWRGLSRRIIWQAQYLVGLDRDTCCSAHCKWHFILKQMYYNLDHPGSAFLRHKQLRTHLDWPQVSGEETKDAVLSYDVSNWLHTESVSTEGVGCWPQKSTDEPSRCVLRKTKKKPRTKIPGISGKMRSRRQKKMRIAQKGKTPGICATGSYKFQEFVPPRWQKIRKFLGQCDKSTPFDPSCAQEGRIHAERKVEPVGSRGVFSLFGFSTFRF